MQKDILIYYDGDCPVCTKIKEKLEASSAGPKLAFTDANTAELPPSISREALLADLHVLDRGEIYVAGDALPRIALRMRGWSMIAPILEYPPFVWGVSLFYRLLADHRPFVGHFL